MYSLFTDVSQLSEKIICKVLLKVLLIVLDRLFYLKVVTGLKNLKSPEVEYTVKPAF